MHEIKIQIDKAKCDELQALSVEVESRQSLLAFMINRDMINSESFLTYQKEYQNFYLLYDEAKIKFQKEYINPLLFEKNIDLQNASWKLDFNSQEVTITYT